MSDHEMRRSERSTRGQQPDWLGISNVPVSGSQSRPSQVPPLEKSSLIDGTGVGTRPGPSTSASIVSHSSTNTVRRKKSEIQLELLKQVSNLEKEYEEELEKGELIEIDIERLTVQITSSQADLDAVTPESEDGRVLHQQQVNKLNLELGNRKVDLKAQQMSVNRKARALSREKGILEQEFLVEEHKIDEEEDAVNNDQENVLIDGEYEANRLRRVADWNSAASRDLNLAAKTSVEDLARAQEVEQCLEEQRVAKLNAKKYRQEAEDYEAQNLKLESRLKNLISEPAAKSDIIHTNPMAIAPERIQPPAEATNIQSDLKQFMARQSHSKELPFFSGKTEEWLTFLCTYERTTELCGFSDAESLVRLQKCLRGDALKLVQAKMISPQNVDSIMRVLKRRFGQPEHIVREMVHKAKCIVSVKEDRPDTLIEFGTSVDNLTTTMQALKCYNHLSNPMLLDDLEKKLPLSYKLQWLDWLEVNTTRVRDLLNFSEWLDRLMDKLCKLCPPLVSDVPKNIHEGQRRNRRQDVVLATKEDSPKPDPKKSSACLFCEKKGHTMDVCFSFLREDVDSRWKTVKELKVCYGCLKLGHIGKNCDRKSCGIDGCQRPHHPTLHFQKRPDKVEKRSSDDKPGEFEDKAEINTNISGPSHFDKLLRIIPVILRGPNGTKQTYAILDEGSTVTMLQTEMAKSLGLEGRKESLCIQWFNGLDRREEQSSRVKLEVSGDFDGVNFFRMENVRTIPDLMIPAQSLNVEKLKKRWPHLRRMRLSSMDQAKPTLLIGIDNARLTVHKEILEGPPQAPIATRTRLGWALGGPLGTRAKNNEFVFHVCEEVEDENDLHRLMKDFFSTESFGVKIIEKKLRSKQDERALAILESKTKRVGDKWETGLLWKSDDTLLPESKKTAAHRLTCMERKMDRVPAFGKDYCAKIVDYEEKGYIKKLTESEAGKTGPTSWYLPHFGVTNPNKPGKLRLVFDAAAKSGGISLNDALLTGPDLLRPLPVVLWNFRLKPVAFTADIEEMFHQVKMKKEDRSSLRFLWRGMSRDRPPDTYEMQVMVFGATSSPSSAIYVKDRNAEEWSDKYPEAVRAITMNHYMDDYLGNAESVAEASKLAQEVIEVHGHGGFKICKWESNSKEFLKSIPKEFRATGSKNFDNKTELPVERVLGLWWNAESDEFTFKSNFHKVEPRILDGSRRPTKREMASLVMSLYDPLGFVAHFKIKGLMLLQEAWKSEVVWDDKIPEALYERWIPWVEELRQIEVVRIPRCYSLGLGNSEKVQLHMFVDASEEAFAAVAYLRVEVGTQIDVTFLDGKVRVAPIKKLTVPRLELQAALMGSRITETLKKHLDTRIDSLHFWSDSRTVLCWLRSETINFRQFVAFRVGEILELTEVSSWKWIPTALNVADDATRGNKPSDFSRTSRWFNGPEFLKLQSDSWPKENRRETEEGVQEEDLEIRHVVTVLTIAEDPLLPDVSRFSSWTRLVRSTAMVIKTAKWWREKSGKQTMIESELNITVDEIRHAESLWWKKVQADSFTSDIHQLNKCKPLERGSRLSQLSPFLDKDGVLRVRGGIDAAPDLPVGTKRPVILDPKHPYTKLLVDHYHKEGAHQGQSRVVNDLRQRFWILDLRSAVRASWARCQDCRNKRAQPVIPEMGALPLSRLTSRHPPFNQTGVDYFGPMEVTIGRSRVKRWGALFTCMATRAIHLEISPNLDTDQMILTLMRFINRRGRPLDMYSDNGTNFVGADAELRKSLKQMDQSEIVKSLAIKGIRWHFIPPSAPHMGGSWERMVQIVKKTLKRLLLEKAPKEFTLLTLMTEVENIVNSRPLTDVSNDPADPESLTPNHFLKMSSDNGPSIPGDFDDKDLHLRKQWKIAQRMADHFWTRWVREYLPTLVKRDKWHVKVDPIKVGTVVIIVDDQTPRNNWMKGIVTEAFPGEDGQVRVVEVRTATGTLRRPVAKICPLDVENKSPSDFMGGRMSARVDI